MPRLQIDVSDELYTKLKILSERTGLSVSAICRGSLDSILDSPSIIYVPFYQQFMLKPGRKPK